MANYRRSIHDLIYGRQTNRILRLSFPNNDPPAAQFLVNKLDAVESVSRDFEFTVELLSDDAGIALKEMQGKLLSIELVRQDGSLRYFSGYVFSFRRCHSDGGLTFYEARLGPWMKFLGLRKDNYLFHGQTLREQMESICRNYGVYPVWDWRVTADDPAMTDACQFDESDFNYVIATTFHPTHCYASYCASDEHKSYLSQPIKAFGVNNSDILAQTCSGSRASIFTCRTCKYTNCDFKLGELDGYPLAVNYVRYITYFFLFQHTALFRYFIFADPSQGLWTIDCRVDVAPDGHAWPAASKLPTTAACRAIWAGADWV
jgi:hypothetical protein